MTPILASFLGTILEVLSNYDALIGFAISWAVAGSLFWRVRSEWKSKKFIEQINFSLNDIRDGKLVLRTLVERSATAILVSPVAVKQFSRGIRDATEQQPFFALESDDDWGYCLRACLNDLSEMFAATYVAQALRLPVHTARFVFGVSYECYGSINTRKIRVIVVAESLLKEYFLPDSDPAKLASIQFEDPKHRDRVLTLQALGRLYASDKPLDKRRIGVVELGVPTSAA